MIACFVRLVSVIPRRHSCRAIAGVALLSGAALLPASAQLVVPKTVPVQNGQQFDLFPSVNGSMAGVSIALDDSLLDPFMNPAKGVRARQGVFSSSPFSHHVSGNRGGGRTLPIGGMVPFGDWTVAGLVAIQQLDRAGPMQASQFISDRSAMNQYVTGVVSRRVNDHLALGLSASWGGLGAVDGVDLLYAGSDRITQAGDFADLRAGLVRDWGANHSVEVLLLHNRFSMTHDAHYTTWRWDSVARRSFQVERTDHNDDRTDAWSAHVRYVRPYGDEGWRFGWIATATRLTHPKIPTYQLVGAPGIPRDPGATYGFNAGLGVSRVRGNTTFGADFILEPMSSNTWGEAARDTAVAGGDTVRAGGKTVENGFRFSNTRVRLGLSHDIPVDSSGRRMFSLQLGLDAYSVSYRLGQTDNVRHTFRSQREGWMEWTPTLGLRFRSHDFQVQYTYVHTCSGPTCLATGDKVTVTSPNRGDTTAGTIIFAPTAPLTFDGGTATMHRLAVTLPIR